MNITVMFQDVYNIILIYERTLYILFLKKRRLYEILKLYLFFIIKCVTGTYISLDTIAIKKDKMFVYNLFVIYGFNTNLFA